MAYVVQTDVSSYLQPKVTHTTAQKAVITSLIPAVEAAVDNYCNRTWKNANTDITETFDGNTDTFFPEQIPVASITSITIDGQLLDPTTYYNYKQYIKLLSKTFSLPQGVVIVYKTESTAVPADVKQAIIQWVAQMFQESEDAGRSTDKAKVEGVEMTYKPQTDSLPDFVRNVLDSYVIIPL